MYLTLTISIQNQTIYLASYLDFTLIIQLYLTHSLFFVEEKFILWVLLIYNVHQIYGQSNDYLNHYRHLRSDTLIKTE